MNRPRFVGIAVGVALLAVVVGQALAQGSQPGQIVAQQVPLGSAFTYQGQLTFGGTPVNGVCVLQFRLFDAETGGAQIGPTVFARSVSVVNGLFTVRLDFGSSAFLGEARWLEVAVQCGSDASFTTLTPLQPLTPVPYALHALTADTTYLQRRVSGTCASGNAIRVVNADGTVTCQSVPGEAAGAWALTGNAGTSPATNFLGTTDNMAFEVRVSNARVLRLEPSASSPNVIGGFSGNSVSPTVSGATISGGGESVNLPNRVTDHYGTVGGGKNNQAGDGAGTVTDRPHATVGGGDSNTASGYMATVGGGRGNAASGDAATVGGGRSNLASGAYATVGGGDSNTASGIYATVGAGRSNLASGNAAAVGGGWGNTASSFGATVGGGDSNTASGEHATVGGGDTNTASGSRATVGGGQGNTASSDAATIGGGYTNTASRLFTTVAGGYTNTASGDYDTVGGGRSNIASGNSAVVGGGHGNTASGGVATVGGGLGNTASGFAATVGGGDSNTAQGMYSFAAGRRAKGNHQGAFVWADSTDTDFASTANDQFNVRAAGGARIFSNSGATIGVQLAAGGNAWSALSDRNLKENITPVDGRGILQRLGLVPVSEWNLKSQDRAIRHIGPMAQDFAAAFGVGEDDRHISTVDADGVALAAIQGLYQLAQEQDAQIAAQQQQIAALETRLAKLEALLAR